MSRRTIALLALALLALVPIGRWEASRHVDREARGMREVLDAIGSLDSPSLSGYRVLGSFDCLTYRRGAHDFALEVCADAEGRVVEAMDRRGEEPRIWSLRADPARSPVRVDRGEFDALLRRMQAPVP